MEEKKEEVVVPVVEETPVEIDPIAAKDEEIAKLIEERDNYKEVALKRLGKLPGDSSFLNNGEDKDVETLIEEKVKAALIDKEIALKEQEKKAELNRIIKENQELRLALKNRPGGGVGSGDGGSSVEVKDNVFSNQQLDAMKARAKRLNIDPEKYIENAKKNLLSKK